MVPDAGIFVVVLIFKCNKTYAFQCIRGAQHLSWIVLDVENDSHYQQSRLCLVYGTTGRTVGPNLVDWSFSDAGCD